MEPHFVEADKLMFYSYLDNSENYFEYGSGGSTYQALIRDNIKSIYSVESDIDWYNKVNNNTNLNHELKKFNYIYNDMNTKPNNWGYPGKNATIEQKVKYSNQFNMSLDDDSKKKIDLILIDGRFRVACCLKLYNNISMDCLIAFDDFLNRKYYHVVLNFFDIINKTGNKMVILKKKKDILEDELTKLIKKYELIEK